MSCPGDNYVVPGANPCANGGGGGVAGVASLNTQTGAVNIVPSNATILVTQGGGQIGLEAVLGGNVVTTLNGCIDDVNITSSNGSVGITTNTVAKTVDLSVPGAIPATVTNILATGDASVSNVGTVFTVNVPLPAVPTSVTGSGIATVSNVGTVYNVEVPAPPEPLVSNITGSGIANVTQVGTVFNVEVPATAIGVASLNTLNGVVNISSIIDQIVVGSDTLTNTITLNTANVMRNLFGGGHNAFPDNAGIVTVASPDGSLTVDCLSTPNTVNLTANPVPFATPYYEETNTNAGIVFSNGNWIDLATVTVPQSQFVAGKTYFIQISGSFNIIYDGAYLNPAVGSDYGSYQARIIIGPPGSIIVVERQFFETHYRPPPAGTNVTSCTQNAFISGIYQITGPTAADIPFTLEVALFDMDPPNVSVRPFLQLQVMLFQQP